MNPDPVLDKLGIPLDAPAHDVLGIEPATNSPDAVLAALRERLRRVNEIAGAGGINADAARVVLHDAAGAILSAIERAQETPASHQQPTPATVTPRQPPKAQAVSGTLEQFESQVRMALAKYGGWNRESSTWIGMLARRHGVNEETLAATVARFTGSDPSHAAATQIPTRTPMLDPEVDQLALRRAARHPPSRPGDQAVFAGIDEEPTPRQPSLWTPILVLMAVVGVGVAVIVATVMLIIGLGSQNQATPTSGDEVVAQAPPTPITAPEQFFPAPREERTPATQSQAGSSRPSEWADVLRDMSRSGSAMNADPDAAHAEFLNVMSQMARRWPEAGSDGVLAGVNGVIDYLYRVASRQDLAMSLIDALAHDGGLVAKGDIPTADSLPAAVWGAGMLARLSRERELGSAASRRVSDSVAQVLGASLPANASFQNGAAAALARLGDRLIPIAPMDEPATTAMQRAWKAWIACLDAVDPPGGSINERTKLLALERIMTDGPDPTYSLATADAIRQITLSLTWRSDGQARDALLRWLDLEAIATPDLNVLTTALGTQSGVEGIDVSFALSSKAGWSHRVELRDRLATLWGSAPAVSRSELVTQWSVSVRNVLGAYTEGTSPTQRLARAARLAKLSSTAARLWIGEAVGSRDLQADLESDLEAKLQSAAVQQATYTIVKTDKAWAGRYAAAGQSITTKRELWAQLNVPLHPVEAEMVAEDAVRGSPSQLRGAAVGVVQRFAADRSMINAMLELVPVMPATNDSTQMIQRLTGQTLPGPREPSWRPELRRVLVERLILVIAGSGEQGVADPLSEVIAHAYLASSRAGSVAKADPITDPLDHGDAATSAANPMTPPADECARQLRARWEQASASAVPGGREAISAAQLSVRRAARTGLASGPIQRFHAEQIGIVELMAYVIASEQPSRAMQASEIVTAAHDKRRRANHVLEQVEIAEEAITRLWLLRFGEAMP